MIIKIFILLKNIEEFIWVNGGRVGYGIMKVLLLVVGLHPVTKPYSHRVVIDITLRAFLYPRFAPLPPVPLFILRNRNRNMVKPTEISSSKMFDGYNKRYEHLSSTLGCSMTFSIYFPPSPPSKKLPVTFFSIPPYFFQALIFLFWTFGFWISESKYCFDHLESDVLSVFGMVDFLIDCLFTYVCIKMGKSCS